MSISFAALEAPLSDGRSMRRRVRVAYTVKARSLCNDPYTMLLLLMCSIHFDLFVFELKSFAVSHILYSFCAHYIVHEPVELNIIKRSFPTFSKHWIVLICFFFYGDFWIGGLFEIL